MNIYLLSVTSVMKSVGGVLLAIAILLAMPPPDAGMVGITGVAGMVGITGVAGITGGFGGFAAGSAA